MRLHKNRQEAEPWQPECNRFTCQINGQRTRLGLAAEDRGTEPGPSGFPMVASVKVHRLRSKSHRLSDGPIRTANRDFLTLAYPAHA